MQEIQANTRKREKTMPELKCSGIYAISSTIDHKMYIGFSYNIRRRFVMHKSSLRRNIHYNYRLQSFYNKNGQKSLSFSIIEKCSADDMSEREKYWISHFNSFKNGFNLTIGGDKSPMESKDAQKLAYETRIKNGKAKIIYAYEVLSGDLKYALYGYRNTSSATGVPVSRIATIVHGGNKTSGGYHFSHIEKTKEQVLKDVISMENSTEQRERHRIRMRGEGNPMFGKKRPDAVGEKNPFAKMIKNGYVVPNKRKISTEEILQHYKDGMGRSEIAELAGCGRTNISIILRQNGLGVGKGGWRAKSK